MIVELWVLLACVMIMLVLVFVQQIHIDRTMGAKYAISNRGDPRTPSDFGGRADRALANVKENLILYAPVALMIAIAGATSGITQLGALLFLGGRVVHAVTYLAGIVLIRSLAWMAGIIGLLMMMYGVATHAMSAAV